MPDHLPAASVVVYTCGASSRLPRLLEALMTQDYPGDYEVIVVNDGEDPLTNDVLLLSESKWSNLRHTFTPASSSNLSPRKLAITLGIKAARNSIIVNTTTDAIPTSSHWLARMVSPFLDPSIEIAVGTSSLKESAKTTGIKGANRSHYCLVDSIVILDAALRYHTFCGDANNLAYRRDLFFSHNGFSESLDIYYGDDDLFVNTVATYTNTATVISPESITKVTGNDLPAYYRNLRLKRAFTVSHLRQTPRALFNFSLLTLYIWLVATIVAAILNPLSIIWQGINFATTLLLWIPLYIGWITAAKTLKYRQFRIGLPWFLFSLPWRKFYYKTHCRAVHKALIRWNSTIHSRFQNEV